MTIARQSIFTACFALASLFIVGCPGSVRPDSGAACPPGTPRACTCDAGATGTQTCGADGAVGECVCVAPDASADATTIDAMDAGALGEFGAVCVRDEECASGICLVVGHCSRPCMARSDCPASTNWQCLSLPGRGQICACAGIAGMQERACNGLDDNCDGVIDEGTGTCDGACVDLQRDPRNCGSCGLTCGGGQVCTAGVCGCPAERSSICGSQCVNVQTDAMNCSRCGMVCPSGMTGIAACTAGVCSLTCPLGTGDCDRDPANGCETDTRSALAHCGMCSHACTFTNATGTCSTGACVIGSCSTGFANCDGDPSNGCETTTATSVMHCGGCGMACSPANGVGMCVASVCGLAMCNPGFANCDASLANGCEANFATDVNNCGMCGRMCSAAAGPNTIGSCAAGTCSSMCVPGFANCDGATANGCEVDVRSSVTHCGACGRACAAGEACSAGVCTTIPCPGPDTRCAGLCVDLATSNANCGACGAACPGAQRCVARTCSCVAPNIACGTACVDPASDTSHCGSCGMACPSVPNGTAICASSRCGARCDAGYFLAGGVCATGTMPPRPIAPLSVLTVGSRRPTLRWLLAPGTDGAHVQLCRDRACTMLIAEFDAAGSQAAPATDLPTGFVFWRLAGRIGPTTGSAYSATWQFHVGVANSAVGGTRGSLLDVNGDGFTDVAIGTGIRGVTGTVVIYYGSATGPSASPSATLMTPYTGGTDAQFGLSISAAPDLNGDGFGDFVVSGIDRANVFLGGPTGLGPPQVPGGVGHGYAVVGAGDTDGDGYGDVISTRPGYMLPDGSSPAHGGFHYFRGGPTGLVNPGTAILGGSGTQGLLGEAIAAGDLNADGFSDVAISAWRDAGGVGAVVVFWGGSSGISDADRRIFRGPMPAGNFGFSVGIVGDLNGDGYPELAVGALRADSQDGRVSIFAGAPGTSISTTPTATITAPDPMANFGHTIAGLGDINNDGFDDLGVSTPYVGTTTGRAYVFTGRAATLTTPTATLNSPAPSAYFGWAFTGVGDVTGDGIVDFAVTAPLINARSGAAYFFAGGTGAISTTPARTILGRADLELGSSIW